MWSPIWKLFYSLLLLFSMFASNFPTFVYEVEISISCATQVNPWLTRLGTCWMTSVQYPFVMTPTFFLSLCLSVSLFSSSFLVSLSFLILRWELESIFRFISVIGLGKGQVGSTAPIDLGGWVQSLIHQRGRNQFIVGLLWCNMNSKVDFREEGFRGKKPNWN